MSDANEIYQAVLEQCSKQIESIKSEYGNQLVKMVIEQISKQYESRIANLENSNAELSKKIARMEQQAKKQQTEIRHTPVSSTNNITNSKEKISIDYHIRSSAFEFNGWLYYANEKMGNFLYKVKTDGSCNQQLTDYSVRYMRTSKVKDGKLIFNDSEYREHSIDL